MKISKSRYINPSKGAYWLIWAKAIVDQMPKNKRIDNHTYRGQGYREACNDIALALDEKLDELRTSQEI